MIQPGRKFNSSDYRFGFQGQEKDDELKGVGNSISFKYRIHDPRLGRFLSVDPLSAEYPFYSPYSFSGNRVLDAVELEGLEPAGVSWPGKSDGYGVLDGNQDGSVSKQELTAADQVCTTILLSGATIFGLSYMAPYLMSANLEVAANIELTAVTAPDMLKYFAIRYPKLISIGIGVADALAPSIVPRSAPSEVYKEVAKKTTESFQIVKDGQYDQGFFKFINPEETQPKEESQSDDKMKNSPKKEREGYVWKVPEEEQQDQESDGSNDFTR